MFILTVPASAALRAAAFALLSASPDVPSDILSAPAEHRSAVRALLLQLADGASSPGRIRVECELGAGGVPIDVARDAWLLAGASLAS